MMKEAEERAEAERNAALKEVQEESAAIIKEILVKAVELDPKAVDEALIRKAAKSI